MTDNDPSDDESARCRDALILKMASQPPMSHDELKAKLAAERPAKGGKKRRGTKPAPKS
jgi:hypothetical protein